MSQVPIYEKCRNKGVILGSECSGWVSTCESSDKTPFPVLHLIKNVDCNLPKVHVLIIFSFILMVSRFFLSFGGIRFYSKNIYILPRFSWVIDKCILLFMFIPQIYAKVILYFGNQKEQRLGLKYRIIIKKTGF